MDNAGTARQVEAREVILVVNSVKQLNEGIEEVKLTPQYNQALGDRQLLTSGSRTMEPWILHVPQNTSIFKQGNAYKCSIELFTGRTT